MTSTISIPLSLDGKGFIDRACPKCSYRFKVKDGDWPKPKATLPWIRAVAYAFCPMCGHKASSDKWHTPEQVKAATEIAMEKARQMALSQIDKSLSQLARSFQHNPFIRMEYKPSFFQRHIRIKTPFDKALEREVVCSKCNATYAVVGSAFFCPVCGENTILASFTSAMSNIGKALDAIPATRKVYEEHGGIDFAEDQIRHLIERSVGDVVSSFQVFALGLYDALGGQGARPNDFQKVTKGSSLFRDLIGKEYSEWLSAAELDFLIRMFQRRHLLEHCNGLVDEEYLKKTKDAGYKVGERIIIRIADVRRLQSLILTLGNGLQTHLHGADHDKKPL